MCVDPPSRLIVRAVDDAAVAIETAGLVMAMRQFRLAMPSGGTYRK
jgi:hypothetical protein